LRDQAIAIETQREIDTKEYVDLTAAQRATIIKCLFQLKGMTGFSKIKGKPAEVAFLEGYEEDVINALNGPLPTAGATALNSDVVLAAEGVRLVTEHTAATTARQQQQSSLDLLRNQAVGIETQREIDNKKYEDLTAMDRATIIKCLFQLKGMTGFSKIKGKPAEVDYLEGYEEDVIDALNRLPDVGATTTAGGGDAAGAMAVGASTGDGGGASAAASRRPTEDIDRDLAAEVKAREESDARMTALLAERAASAAAE